MPDGSARRPRTECCPSFTVPGCARRSYERLHLSWGHLVAVRESLRWVCPQAIAADCLRKSAAAIRHVPGRGGARPECAGRSVGSWRTSRRWVGAVRHRKSHACHGLPPADTIRKAWPRSVRYQTSCRSPLRLARDAGARRAVGDAVLDADAAPAPGGSWTVRAASPLRASPGCLRPTTIRRRCADQSAASGIQISLRRRNHGVNGGL